MDRKWWTLSAVCTGTFMLLLDITVVNVALPAIQRSLHSSFADLQWVVDAYALTLASFLLTAGVRGRHVRPSPTVRPRAGHFFGVVAGLRAVHHPSDAQSGPRGPGGGRRHHVRHLPGPDRPGLHRQGAGDRLRRLRGGDRGGRGHRPAGGRGHSPAASGGGGSSSSTCPSGWWPSPSRWPRSRTRGIPPVAASTGSDSSLSRCLSSCWCSPWSRGTPRGWRSPTIVGLLVGVRRC